MKSEVVVVNYGFGNVTSVVNALMAVGLEPIVTSDPEVVARANRLLLPGVGAFGRAMETIRELDLDVALKTATSDGAQLLGVCLGMQLLFTTGSEFGTHDGLDLIDGEVVHIAGEPGKASLRKSTHIAWAEVAGRESEVLVQQGGPFYFVHSFVAKPSSPMAVVGEARYVGRSFPAAVRKERVAGVQFHPEKSGPAGLQLLRDYFSAG
jgi:imidazole glycerol-phosphate synthase subunit HisH